MRNKKLIIGIIVIVAFIALVLGVRSLFFKGKKEKKVIPAAQAKGGMGKKALAAKKTISKGKGALTVKILNSKKAEIPMRVRIFKTEGSRSSVYAASTVGGRAQELLPGTYDIEVDSLPQKIFKGIKVNEGRETVENTGSISGSITVKTINAKKTPAYYPLRILYSKTNEMVTAFMTNKALELTTGVYDIEIGTSPRQYKKDVKIEAGKGTIVDLGCLTGTLIIKTMSEDKIDMRYTVRITKPDTKEIVSSGTSNKPIELGKGRYNIEVLSSPRQSKKDVVVNAGEESMVEFTVAAPPAPRKDAGTAPRVQAVKSAPAPARVSQ